MSRPSQYDSETQVIAHNYLDIFEANNDTTR